MRIDLTEIPEYYAKGWKEARTLKPEGLKDIDAEAIKYGPIYFENSFGEVVVLHSKGEESALAKGL